MTVPGSSSPEGNSNPTTSPTFGSRCFGNSARGMACKPSVLLGAVVDFLDVHAAGYHWPAFNLADSAITCGAALLIWDSLRRPRLRESA